MFLDPDWLLGFFLKPLITPLIDFMKNGLVIGGLHEIFYFENMIGLSKEVINNIFAYIGYIAISLITLKLLWKYLNIYVFETDGDSTVSPIEYLKGYIKGLVTIFCFNFLYIWFGDISIDIIDKILSYIGDISKDMQTASGLMMLIFTVVYTIMSIILYIKILVNGVRLLVLRLGIPLFAIGLVDSDNGQFNGVIKMMFRTASTILIQLGLLQLSLIPLVTHNTYFSIGGGIAILCYAFNAGDDLREILFSTNVGSNMLSKSLSSIRMVTNVFRR